jgi:hypothetical protein
MAGLWDSVLPVLQKINSSGGLFTPAFISRAVIDEIDRLADLGDATLTAKRGELLHVINRGNWPDDAQSFSALFEIYYEGLFHILASLKGVALRAIPTQKSSTPDFATVQLPTEQFEMKTIDFSGGSFAYAPIMKDGLVARTEASAVANKSGVGFGVQVVKPHGSAKNIKEAIEKVMSQIGGNVKTGQFQNHPTFLVVPMIRTAIRAQSEELLRIRNVHEWGGDVSGHLWTIAASPLGEHFLDALPHHDAADLGPLNRAGILADFPFVAGVIFLDTTWHKLGSADFAAPFPPDAFKLHGIWNDDYVPLDQTAPRTANSAFYRLCDVWQPSRQ